MSDKNVLEELEERKKLQPVVEEEEFFKKLGHELRTQDNRITSCPLFCVEQKQRVYGDELCDPDGSIFVLERDPSYGCWDTVEEAVQELKEDEDDDFDPEEDLSEIFYHSYWEFVTAHFTETAAQLYIDQNKHNLKEPRIFVSSQYRCHEFNQVVKYIRSKE